MQPHALRLHVCICKSCCINHLRHVGDLSVTSPPVLCGGLLDKELVHTFDVGDDDCNSTRQRYHGGGGLTLPS